MWLSFVIYLPNVVTHCTVPSLGPTYPTRKNTGYNIRCIEIKRNKAGRFIHMIRWCRSPQFDLTKHIAAIMAFVGFQWSTVRVSSAVPVVRLNNPKKSLSTFVTTYPGAASPRVNLNDPKKSTVAVSYFIGSLEL